MKAINWLIRMAKPRYHFHGHTHFQRGNLAASETVLGVTKIINVYPYKVIEVNRLKIANEYETTDQSCHSITN